jgi:hypothetical protein
MDEVAEADRRSPTFWALEARLAVNQGVPPHDALAAYDLISSGKLESRPGAPTLNPLQENNWGFSSTDQWGYRRQPIYWPDIGPQLPSPTAGYATWILDPTAAVAESGLSQQLPDC